MIQPMTEVNFVENKRYYPEVLCIATSGIWQTVWLESVPQIYMSDI